MWPIHWNSNQTNTEMLHYYFFFFAKRVLYCPAVLVQRHNWYHATKLPGIDLPLDFLRHLSARFVLKTISPHPFNLCITQLGISQILSLVISLALALLAPNMDSKQIKDKTAIPSNIFIVSNQCFNWILLQTLASKVSCDIITVVSFFTLQAGTRCPTDVPALKLHHLWSRLLALTLSIIGNP